MSSSRPVGRIVRKHKPSRRFTENTYKKAKPYLISDFEGRCGYSLQHIDKIGWTTMEIDHHDPTLKGAARNQYENLFLASRHCNGHKLGKWPSKWGRKKGLRFLNPCKEHDYDFQIFEDPATHLLIPTTPAAFYHIETLQLNADFLVNERRDRAALWRLLNNTPVHVRTEIAAIMEEGSDQPEQLRKIVAQMIPPISPRPVGRPPAAGPAR